MRELRLSRGRPRAPADRIARAAVVSAWAALAASAASPASAQRLDGFNVIAAPGHPFGSASAARALAETKRLGATAVAIVPFLWQTSPSSAEIVRGDDMPDATLRAAIRQTHSQGLVAVEKPHVWVPGSWAGAVAPESDEAWHRWFTAYAGAIERVARIAAEEQAEALVIGTELGKTIERREWIELIAAARAAFPGTLIYMGHNVEEAEAVPFWSLLDAVGVTLYPALGPAEDRAGRVAVMRAAAERLDALAARTGKSVIVGEIGLRSARDATARPWESAEERAAAVDAVLQAEVLADWLRILQRPAIRGVLIWRWFTDPQAGGRADTDFTVQGKPAEGVLLCAWTMVCAKR